MNVEGMHIDHNYSNKNGNENENESQSGREIQCKNQHICTSANKINKKR